MNGWLILALLALATLAGLIRIGRLSRGLWQAAAAAIVLAMTGYALQGRPSLPASPAKPIEAENEAAVALLTMRADMDQSFGVAKRYLVTADSFARSGDYKLSASYIQSGLREYPRDADLWNALGLQLDAGERRADFTTCQTGVRQGACELAEPPRPRLFRGAFRPVRWQCAIGDIALGNGTLQSYAKGQMAGKA